MCMNCEPLIKAIDRYLAKADDELEETLESEGRAVPRDSVTMVSGMEDDIAAVLVDQTNYFIKRFNMQKTVSGIMRVIDEIKANDACGEEIQNITLKYLKKYIPKMVVDYSSIIDSGIKITSVSKRTTAWVESWSKELGKLMQLTSHTEIEDILIRALENGDSVQTATRAILDSGIRNERYKARRAAMTEMFRAQNVSKYEASLQMPSVVSRRWKHSGIGTPRQNHVDMDGQTVDKHNPFTMIGADGDVYYPLYPIDPVLPAEEAINCHCTVDNVVDEQILGLSVEERQMLRDEALAKLDDEWEKEVDAKYRALVGLTVDE